MYQRQSKDITTLLSEQAHCFLLKVLKRCLPLNLGGYKLGEDLFWSVLLLASVTQTTIEAVCQQLSGTISGNRFREHLAAQLADERMSVEDLEERLRAVLQGGLPKKVKQQLSRQAWEVAGDWVEIPYYGKVAEDDKWVRRSAAKAGTTHFNCYASLTIIYRRHRYTIALTLVRRGEAMVEVTKRLIEQVRKLRLRLKLMLLDKAFGVIEVMRYLRRRRIAYIIALARRGGAGGISKLCEGRRSYQTTHRFESAKAGRLKTAVVVVCKYSKLNYRKPGVRYFCYAINGLGVVKAGTVFIRYRRRFAIESGYRQLHQTRARTASRQTRVRLLLIGLAMLIVNVYVLLRRAAIKVGRNGERQRRMKLTLADLREELKRFISQKFGAKCKIHCCDLDLYRSFVNY